MINIALHLLISVVPLNYSRGVSETSLIIYIHGYFLENMSIEFFK